MADQDRELGLLEDAAKASGPAAEQQPFTVAIDVRTGKATGAWKGRATRTGRGYEHAAQYPVTAIDMAAARRHAEILHRQQRGQK